MKSRIHVMPYDHYLAVSSLLKFHNRVQKIILYKKFQSRSISFSGSHKFLMYFKTIKINQQKIFIIIPCKFSQESFSTTRCRSMLKTGLIPTPPATKSKFFSFSFFLFKNHSPPIAICFRFHKKNYVFAHNWRFHTAKKRKDFLE